MFVERTHFTEFFKPVKEAGFDGADGTAERRRNAFERFLRVEAQVQDFPLMPGQALQAAHDFARALVFLRAAIRAGLGGGNVDESGLGTLAIAGPKEGEGDGSSPAKQIAVAMEKDAAEPGEEPALAVVAGDAFPGFEQSFLHEIFRSRALAGQDGGVAQERACVRPA